MPILTGIIFTRSLPRTKTTSIGLAPSLDFLSALATLVPAVAGGCGWVLAANEFVLAAVALAGGGSSGATPVVLPLLAFSFGSRVVTLAMGTVSTFVRERVSIS